MKHSIDSGFLRLHRTVLLLLVSLFATVLGSGCGDDPAASYSLVLRADRTTLTADGSDVAVITVSVRRCG